MNTPWLLELQSLQESQKQELVFKCQKTELSLLPEIHFQEVRVLGSRENLLKLLDKIILPGQVKRFERCSSKYPHQENLLMPYEFILKDQKIKQGALTLVAGPCSAESLEQLDLVAEHLHANNISLMRAGLFKPRSSPYAFQGHGPAAFEWVSHIRKKWNIGLVTEILDPKQAEEAFDLIDMVQVGSRNMHNSSLLKEIAQMNKPVLLKRGFSASYQEWLLAAEYLLHHGAKHVVFCERGIRTFETHTRFTLDINAVAVMKELSPLPVWVDPSHATGQRQWVLPAAKAAVAAGADGLLIEVDPNPLKALSDASQTLYLDDLKKIAALRDLHQWVNENLK
jgi:3-deoxy-7-phosphoheptulonate synthase